MAATLPRPQPAADGAGKQRLTSLAVDLGDGLNLPDSVVRQLNMLDWVGARAELKTGVFVDLWPPFDGQLLDEQRVVDGDLSALRDRGWLLLDDGLAYEGWTGRLTSRGVAEVEELRLRRGDAVGRRRAARDAVLRWLYAEKVAGNVSPVLTAQRMGGWGQYYGLAFTQQELDEASLVGDG